jgi:hypothetical protein
MMFATGVAEWIGWRFYPDPAALDTLLLVEATRAAVLDDRYVFQTAGISLTGDGPVGAPLLHSRMLLRNVYDCYRIRSEGAHTEATSLVLLARHVCPSRADFDRWFEAVGMRLFKLYREESEFGPPVPLEALDPNREFSPEEAPQLVSRFVDSLDLSQNPLLQKVS